MTLQSLKGDNKNSLINDLAYSRYFSRTFEKNIRIVFVWLYQRCSQRERWRRRQSFAR